MALATVHKECKSGNCYGAKWIGRGHTSSKRVTITPYTDTHTLAVNGRIPSTYLATCFGARATFGQASFATTNTTMAMSLAVTRGGSSGRNTPVTADSHANIRISGGCEHTVGGCKSWHTFCHLCRNANGCRVKINTTTTANRTKN